MKEAREDPQTQILLLQILERVAQRNPDRLAGHMTTLMNFDPFEEDSKSFVVGILKNMGYYSEVLFIFISFHSQCMFLITVVRFSLQPVLYDWCNKGRGMCYPVCAMVHIKEPLLLIDKSSLCGGSGFPFSLSEWSLTICLTPYNRR